LRSEALRFEQQNCIALQLQELLFKSYFTDGDYPNAECVSSLAAKVGLSKDEALAYVSNPTNQQRVKEKAAMWSARAVSGKSGCFAHTLA